MDPKKGKKEPDFTEHGVFGLDRVGDLWAIDWFFKQCETDVGIEAFIKLVGLWRPIMWFNEGGLIDKAIGPAIRKRMRETQKFVTVEMLPSLQDKGMKLQAFHARCTSGTVHMPAKRKWADRLIDSLVKFPGGRWDDGPDVCGLIGRGIDQMFDAQLPREESKVILVPFTEKWLEYNDRKDQPKVRYF